VATRADGLPPTIAPLPAVASLAVGAAVGAFALVREGTPVWIAPVLTLALAGVLYAGWTRRDRRRLRLARQPFPRAWRDILEDEVAFYRALEEPERRRFEREVRFFLDEQVIVGPQGAALEDALKVLVAASAVTLIFGRPGYHYPRLRDIVVYEGAFDEDYAVHSGGNILGMVHAQGPILFSARSLRQGFRGDDGHNVGFHEFAHVLDFASGHIDGVPSLMPWGAIRPWVDVMQEETVKVKKRRSLLRQYAATNEAEFFAVATELFFERGAHMKRKHPELYELLREAYGQDPAGR
jgi:Mlc titration factor MtfA (ptsG expression regulator)